MAEGLIFNVQRFSTEDGPGIRTTVFMKGCHLSCAWCHNPEGISHRPQLVWYAQKCIGARDCLKACPHRALKLTPKGIIIDRKKCDLCGDCAEACPALALEVIGKRRTPEDLFEEVSRDRAFYDNSNGGVTISGGEPLTQPDFVSEFMALCGDAGLHIALDSTGHVKRDRWLEFVSKADLILLDIKTMDPEGHREHTGVDLDTILENAKELGKTKTPVWVRVPVIPGYTDDEKNITAIARFAAENLPNMERLDLLAFSNLCISKYDQFEMEYLLRDAKLIKSERMEEIRAAAEAAGAKNAVWSGPARLPENGASNAKEKN
ncbi:MAG: glycyl-radical enzyme activating protein [bacterium]